MSRKVMIVGQGGHSKVIQDMVKSIPSLQIAGFLDDKYETITFSGGHYYGPVEAAVQFVQLLKNLKVVIGVGDNQARENIARKIRLPPEKYMTIAHRSAVISPSARIGYGTVVMANTAINADSIIGNHCIINTGAVVEHDAVVADYVHIAPNGTLTGSVKINRGAHIGAGATVIPGMEIGEWAVIGAGATVISRIQAGMTAVGVPAGVKVKEY